VPIPKRFILLKTPTLTRRRFLQLGGLGAAGVTVATASSGFAQTHQIVVEKVEVWLERLPKELDGLRIVHLSDFHCASERDSTVIRAAVRATNALNPDIVVLTGDYVTVSINRSSFSSAQGAIPCSKILSELLAPMGIFAVLGNHDQCNPQFVVRSLESHGITVLRNFALHIERAGAHFWIAGVDDVLQGKPNLEAALRTIVRDEPTILLAHEPDFADEVKKYPVDLQLSGHSHGGQIRLPFSGATYLPPLARKYPSGLRRAGPLTLYTNRGLGTVVLPVRFDCSPEVTLLTLRSGAVTMPS
jgi:predicted MPP superfamily phosphohydrolase